MKLSISTFPQVNLLTELSADITEDRSGKITPSRPKIVKP